MGASRDPLYSEYSSANIIKLDHTYPRFGAMGVPAAGFSSLSEFDLEMSVRREFSVPDFALCEPRTIRSSKLTGVMAEESTNGVGRGLFDTIEVH